jgi:hypothetical protein
LRRINQQHTTGATEPLQFPEAPRLMVQFADEGKAGLKKGETVVVKV